MSYITAMAKASKLLVIALTIVALALAAATFASINISSQNVSSQNVSSSGTITTSPNVSVYRERGCTTSITSIDWGILAAGGNATQTFYVKNTGTGTLKLGLATSNWNPAAAGPYITASWNRQGTLLSAGQSVAATITLTASSNITGVSTFSNTITISGTG